MAETAVSEDAVPAAKVLTKLHRPDPEREADLFSQPERIDGWTVCGLPLLESELWRRIDFRDGDAICPGWTASLMTCSRSCYDRH